MDSIQNLANLTDATSTIDVIPNHATPIPGNPGFFLDKTVHSGDQKRTIYLPANIFPWRGFQIKTTFLG